MAERLTDIKKKKIIADYIDNNNYRETSRMNKVSVDTVRRLVRNDKDFKQKSTQKKEENTKDILNYMKKKKDDKIRIIDKILSNIELKQDDLDKVTLKELATAYGIIIDKELKCIEINRQSQNNEQLEKVEELLTKIKDEANDPN